MERANVRELKAHASEILRRVREEGATYEITSRGKVVATLAPTKNEGQPVISLEGAFAHLFTDQQVEQMERALYEVRREVSEDLDRLYRMVAEDQQTEDADAV